MKFDTVSGNFFFFFFLNYLANIQCVLYTGASNTQKNSVLHLQNYLAAIFLSRDEGKHYILLPFRRSAFSVTTWHHRTLPKIPIWPKTLIIRWVWIFGGVFFFEKSPSYRRINTVGSDTVRHTQKTVRSYFLGKIRKNISKCYLLNFYPACSVNAFVYSLL